MVQILSPKVFLTGLSVCRPRNLIIREQISSKRLPGKKTFKHRLRLQTSAHMSRRKNSVSIKMNDQFDIQLPVPVNDHQECKDNLIKQLVVGEQ